jgi:uncharacterized sodium:solute symporter family permease YidK
MSYNPHPTDPNKTLLKQEAVISVQGVPLTSYIEDMLTNRVSSNAGKVMQKLHYLLYFKLNFHVSRFLIFVAYFQGRLAIEWVICMLDSEVKEITHEVKEFTTQARKSTDDFIKTAKKSLDHLKKDGQPQ